MKQKTFFLSEVSFNSKCQAVKESKHYVIP